MNNEEKQKVAASQAAFEDWSLEMGLLTPEYLQKVRMAIMIGFPALKRIDVSCDVNNFTMVWEAKFDKFKSLFKKKNKVMKKIEMILKDRFPQYEIIVKELAE